MKKQSLLTLCLATLASILLVSCGGGGGDSSVLPERIEGTTFTLAAGETRRVETETVINVTDSIAIDGTIELAPGASLILAGKEVDIAGTIREASTRKKTVRSRASKPPVVLVYGARGTFSGNIDLPVATDLMIAATTVPLISTKFYFTGSIKTKGEDSTKRGVPGTRSGSVLVATDEVNVIAKERNDTDNPLHYINDVGPLDALEITGNIEIGKGGDGFSDNEGLQSTQALTLLGSDGAKSGDLKLKAASIVLHGNIRQGAGGQGGGVNNLNKIPDHTGVGEAGGDVIGTSGDGAASGVIVLDSPKVDGSVPRVGDSSPAGNVTLAAGNGGPSGRGGNVTGYVGRTPTFVTKPTVTLSSGAGGNAADSRTAAGDGGDCTLFDKDGTHQAAVNGRVRIYAGRGGNGFDGCSVTPQVAGTKGGRGGNLHLQGLPYDLVTNAGNGGAGGSGAPPAAGGISGVDDIPKDIGKEGEAGRTCGGSAQVWDGPGLYPIKIGRTGEVSYKSSALNLDFTIRTDPKTTMATSGISAYPAVNIVNGKKSTANYSDNAEDGSTRIWGSASYDSNENIIQTVVYTPAITIPQGLAVNAPVTQTINQTIYNSGTPSSGQFKVKVTLLGFEDIVTPLGNLKGCAKVATEYASLAGVVSDTQITWFAPGKGQVKWSYEKSGSSQVWNSITDP